MKTEPGVTYKADGIPYTAFDQIHDELQIMAILIDTNRIEAVALAEAVKIMGYHAHRAAQIARGETPTDQVDN